MQGCFWQAGAFVAVAKTGIMQESITGDAVKNARDFRIPFNLASLLRLLDLSDHPCCLYRQRGGQTKGDSWAGNHSLFIGLSRFGRQNCRLIQNTCAPISTRL